MNGSAVVFWGAAFIGLCVSRYAIRLNWLWSVGIGILAGLSAILVFYASMTATDAVMVHHGQLPNSIHTPSVSRR